MDEGLGSVELIELTKNFGPVAAVDHIDLEIRAGEFISLLGPSGCGKTTTLRMLAGFEEPDAGHIRISGKEVQDVPPYRRDVNTVFQHYALFPHMSVAENVAYGLRQKGVDRAEIAERTGLALEMVKMGSFAKRKPRQLSGGQAQRVALARALINRPSVLLLDEPLGALDRKLRQEMQIELKLLQSQVGITFVFVTHDQEEALSMSDRIAVMLDGRIEQLGDPDSVYDEPASAFVAGFIGQQNFLPGVVREGGRVEGAGYTVVGQRVADDAVPGRDGVAAIRPEAVEVTDTDPGSDVNVVAGTLGSVAHLGDMIQFVVLAGDHEILARTPRHDAPRLQAGERVWCRWSDQRPQVFGDDQARLVLADPVTGEAPLEGSGEG